jgi:aspartate racemase
LQDLGKLPEAEREAHALQLAAGEAEQPFDLAQGPLLRDSLLRLGEQDHVLVLTMHHIISDVWSVHLFFRELWALYEAFSSGKPSPLPELPIQYADFAHWQRQWLQGELLEGQLSYWKSHLGGPIPVLQLPSILPRTAVQTFRGARQYSLLPPTLLQSLETLAREEGATLFMTLLAAFKALLYRYAGEEDILVGTPIAGRTRVELEGLIGCFVNTLVLRTNLSGDPTFRELLRRVREVAIAAYAHQDLPFDMLVEALRPERSASRTPLFQVWFVLQNALPPPLELPGLSISPLELDTGMVRHDLRLGLSNAMHGLSVSLEYRTDLFEAPLIAQMVRDFETLLCALAVQPDAKLSFLVEIMAKSGRQQQIMKEKQTQEASLQKLKKVKRKLTQ